MRVLKYDKLVADSFYNLGMIHFERYLIRDKD